MTKRPTSQAEYDARLPVFARLQDEALFILKEGLKDANVMYHSVAQRIKPLSSIVEKAQRMKMSDPLLKMHDVVGLRVVCLFLSDVERIGDLIKEKFTVVKEDNKIEGQEVSSFGYMSHHFVVQMRPEYSGPRYDAIADLMCEIQVRTIAMEAWATASHYLDYKTELAVPRELRRDFFALSGLFYVADRHFEMFFRAREKSRERTAERKPRGSDEINLDSLVAYMRDRFPDREQPDDSADISLLVTELAKGGILILGQIDELVSKHWDAFIEGEKQNPPVDPESSEKGLFAAEGVVRGLLYIERTDIRQQQWTPFRRQRVN